MKFKNLRNIISHLITQSILQLNNKYRYTTFIKKVFYINKAHVSIQKDAVKVKKKNILLNDLSKIIKLKLFEKKVFSLFKIDKKLINQLKICTNYLSCFFNF